VNYTIVKNKNSVGEELRYCNDSGNSFLAPCNGRTNRYYEKTT